MATDKPLNDGTVSTPETPASTGSGTPATPPGKDKFMDITKKFVGGFERAMAWIYHAILKVAKHPDFEPRFAVKTIDSTLARARTAFPPDKFDALGTWLAHSGHAGLVAAQVITLLYYLIAAVVLKDWIYILHGIGIAALLMVLQYAAERFMSAGETLIKASPSRMNSGAFLDCLALLMAIGGVLLLIVYIMQAKRMESWSLFWIGLGDCALCLCVAYIALNPSMANTTVAEGGTAGDEAIGIMSFFVKAVIRIVPLAFGIGAIIGSVALFIAIFSLIRDESRAAGTQALVMIGFCSCLPFLTYLGFVFYQLMIDVIRAILSIPQKLERR